MTSTALTAIYAILQQLADAAPAHTQNAIAADFMTLRGEVLHAQYDERQGGNLAGQFPRQNF